jgi:hypothetical protein
VNAPRYSRLALLTLAAMLAWPASAQSPAPDRVGRLFLTPQQRQELDRRRQLNIKDVVVNNEGTVTVDGHITRSSGRTTTWLNGQPEHDVYRPRDAASVTVQINEAQGSVPLKIGQTVDRAQGTVNDGLGGGSITVNPRPSHRK